jgi:hypothetical protein
MVPLGQDKADRSNHYLCPRRNQELLSPRQRSSSGGKAMSLCTSYRRITGSLVSQHYQSGTGVREDWGDRVGLLPSFSVAHPRVLTIHPQIWRFCYGGTVATLLSQAPGMIDAAVICHPGPLNTADFPKILVPTSYVCAEGSKFVTLFHYDL